MGDDGVLGFHATLIPTLAMLRKKTV